jgi:uncharacterized protein YdhG (YjbR/CyaY superfamily)
MDAKKDKPTNVEAYIAQFPVDVQEVLRQIRAVVREAAPEATERMGYGMPGLYLNGGLVWFGAHSRHVGFYPTPSGIEAFREELAAYKQSKGAVQFPLDKPIPYDLIRKMVRARVAQNKAKGKA